MDIDRLEKDLSERYARVQEAIHMACARSGRTVDEVTLVAVSKTFSEEHVRALYNCGHRDFGENKVQELVEKSGAIASTDACPDLRWHMIGHLQRNKARDVVPISHLFHALDSIRLAREIEKRATALEKAVECLVQINISGETSKFGIEPDAVPSFIDTLRPFERIKLRGFMGMAAPTDDPEDVRPQFARLRTLLRTVNLTGAQRSIFNVLSMGMSSDFSVAIEEGATHVRIGSALFGQRHYT